MFQCLGLGTAEQGGCGEDWWHPGCVVGVGPDWSESAQKKPKVRNSGTASLLESITDVAEAVVEERQDTIDPNNTVQEEPRSPRQDRSLDGGDEEDADDDEDDETPVPPGFPAEEEFEGFICYKCVDANPWIKRYAGTLGFLPAVFRRSAAPSPEASIMTKAVDVIADTVETVLNSSKRKIGEDDLSNTASKRAKPDSIPSTTDVPNGDSSSAEKVLDQVNSNICKTEQFPLAPQAQMSLFFREDFRKHLCRCSNCFPLLAQHPQLLEEEESYEPPLSSAGSDAGQSTIGSGSIYERGESALKNIDRVRAIEGVMAYNNLKEKLTPFFKQFAESGEAISAEDVKSWFAKMRGDDVATNDGPVAEVDKEGDHRTEQSGQ